MKEYWKVDDKQQLVLEEGRLGKEIKQEQTKKLDYKNNCNHWYIHLILLSALLFFCGWCFYISYQNLHFEKIEDQFSIISKKYRELIYESQPEKQNSQPNAETPVIFVKPEIIISKLNNFLEETDLIKKHTKQHKATVTDEYNINAPSSINESDNVVRSSDIDDILTTSLPKDLHDDREFKKTLIWKIDGYGNIFNNDDMESSFLRRLHNGNVIPDVKIITDVEDLENRNVFTEDNHLTLNSHENGASNVDTLNELDRSRSDVPFHDHKDIASLMDILMNSQESKQNQKFSDFENMAQDDRNNNSSSSDTTDEQNLSDFLSVERESYPFWFLKFPKSSEYSADGGSSIFRSVLPQETSEQIENKSSHDIDATDEDEHIDNNDSSISSSITSSDIQSKLGNRVSLLTLLEKFKNSSVQNVENQHSLEIEQDTRENEKYKSVENINNKDSFEFVFPPPTIQDSVKYPWMNSNEHSLFKPSDNIADNSQWKPKDTSTSSEIFISSFNSNEDTEVVEYAIPKFHYCKIRIFYIKGIIAGTALNCSAESSTEAPPDVLHDSDSYEKNIYDDYDYTECDEVTAGQLKDEFISNENSDITKVTSSPNTDASITGESETNTPSIKISNDALLESSETIETDSSANAKDSQDDTIYNEGEKEQPVTTVLPVFASKFDFDTTDPDKQWNLYSSALQFMHNVQQKSTKEQDSSDSAYFSDFTDYSDVSNSENAKTLKIDEHMLEKLIAMYNDELSTFRRMYTEVMDKYASTEEYVDMCNIYPYMCNPISDWNTATVPGKTIIYPQDSAFTFRKKRMIDNLTWQQEISNTLKENGETDLLKNMEKIYQKMEALAACIDRLQERYLLHNKLDDDYMSTEFSRDIERTPSIAYA